jgi:hypothetical protein
MTFQSKLLALFAAACLLPASGAAIPEPAQSLRPRWQVGDRWVVESATRQVQVAEPTARARCVVRWQFEVKAIEKLDGQDCFRIEAAPEGGAVSVLWIDRQSLAVRQVQAGIVVGGRVQFLTENYRAMAGEASPLLSPLPALPIDLPAFPAGETKALGQYTYEAATGTVGQKAVGQIGFAIAVDQEITSAAAPQVKSLATDPFVKDITAKPTVGVRLKGPNGVVRQLWQPGVPWPICSENGATTARLIQFKPARAAEEVRP